MRVESRWRAGVTLALLWPIALTAAANPSSSLDSLSAPLAGSLCALGCWFAPARVRRRASLALAGLAAASSVATGAGITAVVGIAGCALGLALAKRFAELSEWIALVASLDRRGVDDADRIRAQMAGELQRARRHSRPLSLLAIRAAAGPSPEQQDVLIRELARHHSARRAEVRLRELVERELSRCEITAASDGDLLVLLPETEAASAAALAARLDRACAGELGLSLRVGSASFPGDELTLNGLIERARRDLLRQDSTAAAEPLAASRRAKAVEAPERAAPAA
jgi:hypothetical protein